jgi:predicted acetyltransferase
MSHTISPTLIKATMKDYPVIKNMGRFYVYEMSRYCGWECPKDGLYECIDFKKHFEIPDNYPFLIKDREELAGFVIVDKMGVTKDIDWNMAQFFVLAKFQQYGVGKKIAHQVFDQFKGLWEVNVIPTNLRALQFWRKTIREYTQDHFEEALKTIPDPEPHEDIVIEFRSNP